MVNSSSTSPMAHSLINPLVSPNIKVPEVPQYDILDSNSYDRINNFKNKLPLYQDIRLYCKLFQATFQGKAIDCYTRLTPKSINSWLEFYQIFIEWSKHNVPPQKSLHDHYHYRQDKGKFINAYFQRFRVMVALILNVTYELATCHFKIRMHNDQVEFFEFL